jgi:glutamate/tyrosine decarboxylase-like PLP-dependent enzyme
MLSLPPHGKNRDQVFSGLAALAEDDFNPKSGRAFGYTFDAGQEAEEIAYDAFRAFMGKNALDMTFFPSVLKLENEIVAMMSAHLGGDADTVGLFTSGGTESIFCAVKAARDYFAAVRPDITEPEMALTVTAHSAFHKAAHYLKLKVKQVEVDDETFHPDLDELRAAIGPNTILLVGSASCYGNGIVDPIPEMGQIALDHGILMHVDGCIGGFLLPWFKKFGADCPDFDLSVPGVTSISCDLHKYAYAPKGASVVLYKTRDLRRHQIFACANWTGYTMVNTTVQSTKSAGPLAGAWAVMNFLGHDGYEKLARDLYEAKNKLVREIATIPQLQLVGKPQLPLVAFTSTQINVFHVIDEMAKRGWYIQPSLKLGKHRETIHLSVNPNNIPELDAMLQDLREVCASMKVKPGSKAATLVAQTFGRLNPDKLSDVVFEKMLNAAGIQEVGVPDSMAEINDILNALPPPMSERLITEYVNRLFAAPGSAAAEVGGSSRGYRLPTGPRPSANDGAVAANGWALPAIIDRPATRQAIALFDRMRRRLPFGRS